MRNNRKNRRSTTKDSFLKSYTRDCLEDRRFNYTHIRKYTKQKNLYISLYVVTRHYGGPEEQGWWYDWFHHVKSYCRRTKGSNLIATVEKLQREIDFGEEEFEKRLGRKRRNRYSMAHENDDYTIVIEEYPGERETRERPYYC